ncbi:hypothetical protein CBS101457_005528 [Exobasidium rhododendri]|nr:hypothetical protein CBS101457_005528 [Exobasidium rhododendri]
MSDFQPGFLNKPRAREAPKSRNFLVKFWQDEVTNPENLSLVWGTTVFVAGVIFTRTIAKDTIVPMF